MKLTDSSKSLTSALQPSLVNIFDWLNNKYTLVLDQSEGCSHRVEHNFELIDELST